MEEIKKERQNISNHTHTLRENDKDNNIDGEEDSKRKGTNRRQAEGACEGGEWVKREERSSASPNKASVCERRC